MLEHKLVHQVATAIRVVSDNSLERIGWWLLVGPKLVFDIVGSKLGFFSKEK